jgi:hypothetical protein
MFLVRDGQQVADPLPVHLPDLAARWGRTLYADACPR